MARRSTLLVSVLMDLVRSIGNLLRLFSRRFSRLPEPGENVDHWLGREGERLAKGYLRRRGFKILYRNFRAPHGGEVDLVCRDREDNSLVFVEVKTRTGREFGAPGDAVTLAKQKLIAKGAHAWLRMLDKPGLYYRFDIVEIVIEHDKPEFNLIKGAFKMPESYIY